MKKQIIFVHNGFTTFVKKDYQMLSKKFTVNLFYYKSSKNVLDNLLYQIHLLSWLILNIRKSSVVYIWFADYHSFLPVLVAKLFHKKSIIIVGGYDAVSISEIEFGLFYKKTKFIRKCFAVNAYRNADFILPVDTSLCEGTNNFTGKNYIIGVKRFVKHLKGKLIAVPTGYDSRKWFKDSNVQRKEKVLSIGIANNNRTYLRKGFDLLIEVATKMYSTEFIIIGIGNELRKTLKSEIPKNIKLLGKVPNKELIKYYSEAKVYCQLSLSEGLPNTLCEAMLCECIPVGSNVNGIPDAIGDTGFVLEKKDSDKAKILIEKAMSSPKSIGKKARERMIEKFSLKKRVHNLNTIIEELDV